LHLSHSKEKVEIHRLGHEFIIGSSLRWYEGKDRWLFLGNSYDDSLAKLELAIVPSEDEIDATVELFSKAAKAASNYGIPTALIIGPNKESIYPEYLPNEVVPSQVKYSSFFINKLTNVPNLVVHDPTFDLIRTKESDGYLYWKTDTHWNDKGAYIAYRGFLDKFSLPEPKLQFGIGKGHNGDLLAISKLREFPMDPKDDWEVLWGERPVVTYSKSERVFGVDVTGSKLAQNKKSVSGGYVWVIGDSFSDSMKQYFNSTFENVLYLGHWSNALGQVPLELSRAKLRPDMIVIVKVERSFYPVV
jgi:hypothetical protein